MNKPHAAVLFVLLPLVPMQLAFAHPGSGIVVDRQGEIFFTDTGEGVWKIDPTGQVTLHGGPAYHWMTLDHESRLAGVNWPQFVEPSTQIEKLGSNPTLFVASDFPLTTGADGALYYPELGRDNRLRVYRTFASGERAQFAVLDRAADGKELRWLNGMAAGPHGAIYFSENAAVRKIDSLGVVTTIVKDISVADCKRIAGADERLGPMLRGLDVAPDGTIFVAASVCAALLKIAPGGEVTSVLQMEPPWSPTSVALYRSNVYVLEYFHAATEDRRDSVPRVRKIAADGSHRIIAAIERTGRQGSRALDILEGSKTGDGTEIAGVKLRWCPAGSFRMGSPKTEPHHRDDEGQVNVTFTKGFWMGQYEVTQAQWKRTIGTLRGPLTAGVGDDYPVYWVTYDEALEFCRKLTDSARAAGELPREWSFRLPTEAEWEYACRAGTSSTFSFGDTLTTHEANIGKAYKGTATGEPGSAASPVGTYPPNSWGLHDMHGNEFEWCLDWYAAQLPGGTNPFVSTHGARNPDSSYSRVRRGGAWNDRPEFCRSALRLRFEPNRSADHIGFRVVLARE